MENNVTLELTKYNELRDFKINIEKDFCYVYRLDNLMKCVYGKDPLLKELTDANSALRNEISELKKIKENLTFSDLKKMSIWKFIKLKKTL